ncbi:MAG: VWA domain-containing protein [Candidatus Poribacteria bacterium]|nr:VWA domain-containing protein [Candidatus Poribacteria bacterium]
MRFSDPGFLIILLLLPLLIWYLRRRQSGSVRFSDLSNIREVAPSFWARCLPLLSLARFLMLALIIFALARPQLSQSREQITSEGIDILLILDISGSMRAEDFKPNNRLQAAKGVIHDFLRDRKNDRIGLVVFAGESFTQCPLTLDYRVLADLLRNVEIGMVADGTAIGDALANATNRLRDSTAKSKIAILLTDGENNTGTLEPITAAQAARALGIKVYAIGMGKEGGARIPYDDPIFGRQYSRVRTYVDEKTLKEIAAITDGRYFRATHPQKLAEIYNEINQLETTKIEVTEYIRYKEVAAYLLFPATLLLMVEMVLANTRLRKLP